MSPANTYAIRRAEHEDADKREVAEPDMQRFAAGCPLAKPDRRTAHAHGDPLSPASWPCPGWAAK